MKNTSKDKKITAIENFESTSICKSLMSLNNSVVHCGEYSYIAQMNNKVVTPLEKKPELPCGVYYTKRDSIYDSVDLNTDDLTPEESFDPSVASSVFNCFDDNQGFTWYEKDDTYCKLIFLTLGNEKRQCDDFLASWFMGN